MRITKSIVPNSFTLVNIFMGFTAIVATSNGEFNKAALYILVAAIFDMLDGVMARLIKSTSEFGVELDSLCDAVSFGVAPSYMLYKVYFYQFGDLGILLASLPALTGVMRLARFNIMLTSFEDKKYFTGMPIPSAALTIISYIIFFHNKDIIPGDFKPAAITLITIITSLAMVSKIKFDNMPRPSKKSFKQKPVLFIVFFIGVILSVITKGMFILPFMLLYMAAGTIRYLYYFFRENPRRREI